jgi:hypothetical protein
MVNTPRRFSWRNLVSGTTFEEKAQEGAVDSGTRDYAEGHVIYEDVQGASKVVLGSTDGTGTFNSTLIPDPGTLLRQGGNPPVGVFLDDFYKQGDLLGARQFRAYTVLDGVANVDLGALPLFSVVLLRFTAAQTVTLPAITNAMDGYCIRFVGQTTSGDVNDGIGGSGYNTTLATSDAPAGRIGDETASYQLNRGQTIELMAVWNANGTAWDLTTGDPPSRWVVLSKSDSLQLTQSQGQGTGVG